MPSINWTINGMRLLEALEALGVMPDGYCFCYGSRRDPTKPEEEHTGECREAREAISSTQAVLEQEDSPVDWRGK